MRAMQRVAATWRALTLGSLFTLVACGGANRANEIPGPEDLPPLPTATASASSGASPATPTADSGATECGGFESRPMAAKDESLLSDRLEIRPFDGLVNNARPTSIMAAAPAEDAETRLYFEENGKQFVVYVEEMFARPGADLAREVEKSDPYAKDATVEDKTVAGIREIRLTPKTLRADHEKALALRLYAVAKDGLLVRVSFFVSPEVMPTGAGCTNLAKKLADTITLGKRAIVLDARRVTLDAGRAMDLPKDFGFYPQPGADFVVYHVFPVTTLDGPEAGFHIYFGNHPQKPAGTANLTLPLLGKSTPFIDVKDGDHHSREGITQIAGSPGLFMHVFFGASDEGIFTDFEKITSSIR